MTLPKIDVLLQSLFEEKVSGNINETTFKRMVQKYQEEQNDLTINLENLQKEFAKCKQTQKDVSVWIKSIKEFLHFNTLTRSIVVNLIDKILISEAYEKDGKKAYDITIEYKFGTQAVKKEIEPIEKPLDKVFSQSNSISNDLTTANL